jgi:hypothetical protein
LTAAASNAPGGVTACVRTFATCVEGDVVMVQLPAAAGTPGGAERAA